MLLLGDELNLGGPRVEGARVGRIGRSDAADVPPRPCTQRVQLPSSRQVGKAVYFGGEFYVIGGETATGAGATANDVYNRVDIYDPAANSWRVGTAMPTARHGIFPLEVAGRIYVAGGGTSSGNSSSALLEIDNP